MTPRCATCNHTMSDHDQETSAIFIGRCYECDCEGYIEPDFEEDEDFS